MGTMIAGQEVKVTPTTIEVPHHPYIAQRIGQRDFLFYCNILFQVIVKYHLVSLMVSWLAMSVNSI